MAASLASEPESPYQTFFSHSPGTRSISRSASSTAGRLIPEMSPPKVVRSSSAVTAERTRSLLYPSPARAQAAPKSR